MYILLIAFNSYVESIDPIPFIVSGKDTLLVYDLLP